MLLKILSSLLITSQAHAYFSTIDTANSLPVGNYKMSVEPQIITSEYSGFNLNFRFDGSINNDSGFRGAFGLGKVEYHFGGFYKWTPIPDYGRQPAVGLLGGVVVSKLAGINAIDLRVHPIGSKTFRTSQSGIFTPYLSMPFGIHFVEGTSTVPVQLVFGSEWKPAHMKNISFFGELGFNINKAFGYISAAMALQFDEDGVEFK